MRTFRYLITLFCLILIKTVSSQDLQFGNSSDITYLYQDAKRDLQEAIALESLMAEGRFDEVPQFLRQHNYVAVEMENDDDIAYRKNDSVINNRVAGVFPTLLVRNDNVFGDGYSDWQVMISLMEGSKDLFIYKINNQRSAAIAFNKCLSPIVKNLGAPYSLISSEVEGGTATRLGRYKLQIINQDEEFNLTASNFTKLNAPKDMVIFMGPGKIGDINIAFIRGAEPVDGYHTVGLILFTKLNSTQVNENLGPFNTEKFMSLQNFNDIIWDDRNLN